jgi:lipopolysaccharide biosynthesis protein
VDEYHQISFKVTKSSVQKSVCLFSSYFTAEEIPYYIRIYLNELAQWFDNIYFLTNEKKLNKESLEFLEQNDIMLRLYKNEGYDFGMWHKAMMELDISSCSRIALVNDSCILFRSLKEIMLQSPYGDYWGLIDSHQIKWHLQSFFVVIEQQALEEAKHYFTEKGLQHTFSEVINTYEVGLSQHLLQKGFKVASVFKASASPHINPTYFQVGSLIRKGFPVIKKKFIFGNYRNSEIVPLLRSAFNFDPSRYLKLISSQENVILDTQKVKRDCQKTSTTLKLKMLSLASQVMFVLRFIAGKKTKVIE